MLAETGTFSRVTGLLIFYDEPLELIAESVASHLPLIDHLVAVDGAYALYPEGLPWSNPELMRMITTLCNGARVSLTTHVPFFVWWGNEVQKRNHAIRLAEVATDPEGWYLSFDADHVVVEASETWFEDLRTVKEDGWAAIDVGIRDAAVIPGYEVPRTDGFSPITTLFRAVRGMKYGPAHWVMHAPEFEHTAYPIIYFRAPTEFHPVPTYDGTHLMKFEHRQQRPTYRNDAKTRYVERREELGIESFRQNT